MFKACCVKRSNDSSILVREHGMSAVILNKGHEDFFTVRIDGCELNQETSADFLVEKISAKKAVIVELKGQNIKKAILQLKKTVSWLKAKKYDKEVALLVVCTKVNKTVRTDKAIAQNRFHRDGITLNFVEGNQEYIFERLFTFSPLKKKQ